MQLQAAQRAAGARATAPRAPIAPRAPAAPGRRGPAPAAAVAVQSPAPGAAKEDAAAVTARVVEEEAQYVLQTYARPADVVFVRGEGAKLYDAAGKEYLDMAAGEAAGGGGRQRGAGRAAAAAAAAAAASSHSEQPQQQRDGCAGSGFAGAIAGPPHGRTDPPPAPGNNQGSP
jgi:hypothetical protein